MFCDEIWTLLELSVCCSDGAANALEIIDAEIISIVISALLIRYFTLVVGATIKILLPLFIVITLTFLPPYGDKLTGDSLVF